MKSYQRHSQFSRAGGFTLIELMISVAIIAILASIAIPQYSQYKVKAINNAAQAFLLDITQREEQYLLDARSYATGAGALAAIGLSVPTDVSNFYQAPAITSVGTGYQVTLAPLAGGKMDGTEAYKGTLTITNSNPTASISN